jgi:hypothetical protein
MRWFKDKDGSAFGIDDNHANALIQSDWIEITHEQAAEITQANAPKLTKEEMVKQAIAELRRERSARVEAIQVTYNGKLYDGDETSQDRLARSIAALSDGQTISWRASDDSFSELTKPDLINILTLAGQEQTALWIEYANKEVEAVAAIEGETEGESDGE